MTEETTMPAEWAIQRALGPMLLAHPTTGWTVEKVLDSSDQSTSGFKATILRLAAYIEQHEPEDLLLIDARNIAAEARQPGFANTLDGLRESVARKISDGQWDDHVAVIAAHAGLRRGIEIAGEAK